jgi:cohesin loading factor subunit SCC2
MQMPQCRHYGTERSRRDGKARVLAKDLDKTPFKVQRAHGENIWEEIAFDESIENRLFRR